MTDKPATDVAIWKPREFSGSDLIPHKQMVDLAVIEPGSLVGRENIAPEDLLLPVISLLQGTSVAVQDGMEGAQPGKFFNELTEQVFEAPLRVLIIHHFVSRAAFPGTHPHQVEKRCLSNDTITGTEYGDCEACPHTEWVPCDDGKDRQPCARQHNFVVQTEFGPAVLRFRGLSFKAAKKFITAWGTSSHNLWDFPAIVTTKQGEDVVRGQKVKFHTMAMRWELRDATPDSVRSSSLASYEKVNQAHEAGKLQVQDGDDEASLDL